MKPSDQLLYKLLPHIDDKEKFKQYILVFSSNKIVSFYEAIIDSHFEEDKIMKLYTKSTYKNYKAELKPLVIDYLSATILKSNKSKELRRTSDIFDLFTLLNISLFEELDVELKYALSRTNKEEYLNQRIILLMRKLQNDLALHVNSYAEILKTCELYEKTILKSFYHASMYTLQMKVSVLVTTKSTIRTQKDVGKISLLEKELKKIDKNITLKGIQLIYYLQSMICIKIMQGLYEETYNLQMNLIEKFDDLDFSNIKFKQYQIGEQLLNAFFYGKRAKKEIDANYLFSIADKYLSNSEDAILISMSTAFKYLNKDYKKELTVEDIDELHKFTIENEASLFSQNISIHIVCAYATFGKWEKAIDVLPAILGNYPSFKVLTDGQYVAVLLRAVIYFELFKLNHDGKNFESFESFATYAYNKFRKDKKEFPAEIVILKQLLKVKLISTKEEIKEIFKQMKIKLEDTLDEYSSIYWKNYCFSFDFNKWILNNAK